MEEADYLANARLFRGLELEQLAALYQVSEMVTFGGGERIFTDGEPGDCLYVVMEGQVRISITTPALGEEALAIMGPGDSFGEMAVVDRDPNGRSATAITHQDVALLTIGQRDLHLLFDRDPRLGFVVMQNLLRNLSDQLRQTNRRLLFLASAGMFS
jgi:CRP/FNR family cyclic AMP-dependent transcriptional regulator